MQKYLLLILFIASYHLHLSAQSSSMAETGPRIKIRQNQSWKFFLGEPEADFYKKNTNDSKWETIHLPHTLELTSTNLDDSDDDKSQLTFQRKVGWYRKSIDVAPSDRKVFLEFEGAHQVTDLWVNGQHVGQHAVGGYTPFHFDITDFVNKGQKNLICLLVDNRRREDVPPDPGPFDYIKFSGLYRDVYQVETSPVRIPFPWEAFEAGVTFTTPSVDPANGNATIDVKTVIQNGSLNTTELRVVNRLIDTDGMVVLKLDDTKTVAAGQSGRYNQIGGLEENVRFWSVDDPYLYRLNTRIYRGNELLDELECKVGIRSFTHHPRQGFLLNGERIKLIGMNRHQHFPYLGDALPNSLHYKDIKQLKELGFNSIRTAHYPQDDAILEACDELGILVYEEAPTWISIGNELWFDRLEQAARTMIRNHRNHASVVIWGAGINHRGYVPRLHLAAKQEDPTRLTASQNSRWTGWQTSGMTDIYAQMTYGPVDWQRHEPMLAMEGRDGIEALAPYLLDDMLTGLIAWTAHDYYTFHPPQAGQHDRMRPGGIMTLFRTLYPETHFYPVELRDEPQLHIASEWTPETNEVVIYSNAEEIELFVNGTSIGRKRPDRTGTMQAFDHPPFRFPIAAFEAGRLTAKGYQGNSVIAEQSIFTPEAPVRLKLRADTSARQLTADGSDIVMLYAQIEDKNGMPIKDKTYSIRFEVSGPARIVGTDAGIAANPRKSIDGLAFALLQADTRAGEISVTATAEGLQPDRIQLTSVKESAAPFQTAPFTDVEEVRVDLGAADQLLQYEWQAWNGSDGKEARQDFDQWGGFSARLRTPSADGLLRWLGEVNVMGKYGYAFGEGVLGIDAQGLELELSGLPAGAYELMTYHHAPRSNTNSMDPNKERLKSVKLTQVSYAKKMALELESAGQSNTKIIRLTEGLKEPATGVATATFRFSSDGKKPVKLSFTSADSKASNIWLNAFRLKKMIVTK